MQSISVLFVFMSLACFQMIYSLDVPVEDQTKSPQCVSKIELTQMFQRERRASISRPYFHHWRQTRETNRHIPKLSLAFSPRLGKRAIENENQMNLYNLKNFIDSLIDYIEENQIDIVYEDATKVCFSQAIHDDFFQIGANRRSVDENDMVERQTAGAHPLLFRYRLG